MGGLKPKIWKRVRFVSTRFYVRSLKILVFVDDRFFLNLLRGTVARQVGFNCLRDTVLRERAQTSKIPTFVQHKM